MTVIAKWQPNVVVEAVKDELGENMELACKVVEVDARRRLLAIRDPKFGRRYRRALAIFKLTSFVEVDDKAVTGRIGIPKAEKGGDYGFWIEIGSKTAPAHPWLRPALLNNKRDILKLLGGQ